MRYFMFGAVWTYYIGQTKAGNFGIIQEHFPNERECISEVKDKKNGIHPGGIDEVAVLSISELKYEDYKRFFDID